MRWFFMEKAIVPVPTEKLQITKIDDPNKIQPACQLTVQILLLG